MHVESEMFTPVTVRGLSPASLTGTLITFAAIRSGPVSGMLILPASQAMGKPSFPLYLAHGIIAASLVPILIIWTGGFGEIDTLDASLIALAAILGSLAFAQLLLPVERFTLSFIKRFGRAR